MTLDRRDRFRPKVLLERCRTRGDGFSCRESGECVQVELWGALPPAWAGNLSLHCFASGLDIESADAVQALSNRWAARFVMRRTRDRSAHAGADFLAMARRAPRAVPQLPEPRIDVRIVRSREVPGGVFAEVTGEDSIGLLAELLRRFDAFGLQPRQFALASVGEGVRDWFWLDAGGAVGAAVGGGVPVAAANDLSSAPPSDAVLRGPT